MQPRDLSDHVAYQAGRGIEEVARELGRDPAEFIKLASNENPHGPSPAAVEAIRETASSVNAYPKAAHADLTAAIAAEWGVDDSQVWLANGGDGALDYLHRAMLEPDDAVLVPEPGFAYYGMSARFHHGAVETYALERAEDFEQTADSVLEAYDGERVVYLTSPHNPTGTTIDLAEIEHVAEETAEETLVVVDEAYGEFAAVDSALALTQGRDGFDARDDVAILRTFSKAYGLAGVRLGYAVVPEAWGDAYARVNTPFAASELACRAGLAAFDDDEHVERTVETTLESREYMRETIDAHVWPSEGNFVLVAVGDAAAVAEEMQQRGVIVRDCTSFGLPGCIRITCGTDAETERAVETLNAVLADLGLPEDGAAEDPADPNAPEVSDS
ncbi:histidinol-phosphate transaminase [Halostagnicola kamekurae]|uniref:Histidinol-phosphate aminotransferase n=1 Tax=Halostagnicola kamekurae TaxID=619731 RepID=A0A1I6SXH2_9EURY|nr:histidinol-phosphate transaminase [Halostagnicola kamekurae]SFS81582.1 histidinol-phosphate aminotransferase [Halostagnicola kamekurae]